MKSMEAQIKLHMAVWSEAVTRQNIQNFQVSEGLDV